MDKKKKPSSVLEVYDGKIVEMRQDAYSLEAIGQKVGVTRERIRQILYKHFPGVKPLMMVEMRLARIIGCFPSRLQTLRRQGVLNPEERGRFHCYSRDEAEKAILALQRQCKHCDEPLPLNHLGKYCLECRNKKKRNPYQFLSEEAKRKHLEACKSWIKRHPERARELRREVQKRYRERHR